MSETSLDFFEHKIEFHFKDFFDFNESLQFFWGLKLEVGEVNGVVALEQKVAIVFHSDLVTDVVPRGDSGQRDVNHTIDAALVGEVEILQRYKINFQVWKRF